MAPFELSTKRMKQMKALIILLSAQILILSGLFGNTNQFEILIPEDYNPEDIQIRYFMTGPFGGVGGFISPKKKQYIYTIDISGRNPLNREISTPDSPEPDAEYIEYLEQNGYEAISLVSPDSTGDLNAKTMKIIAYKYGNKIFTYSCDDLSDLPLKRTTLEFEPLPLLSYKCEIRDYKIESECIITIMYSAFWAHKFFGIMDGFVKQFELQKIEVDQNGLFSMEIPNFSFDPVTVQYRDSQWSNPAQFTFRIRAKSTGNFIGSHLVPLGIDSFIPRGIDVFEIKEKFPNGTIIFDLIKYFRL